MDTFHIRPADPLAADVAEEVRSLAAAGVPYVAIRGQQFEDGDAIVYDVIEAPHDYPENGAYVWSYVDPRQWIAEFDRLQGKDAGKPRMVSAEAGQFVCPYDLEEE